MRKKLLTACVLVLFLLLPTLASAQYKKPTDVIPTDTGDVSITFLGHSSLMLEWAGKVIHVDPWSAQADYAILPKADLVLITHEHRDHLDTGAIDSIRKNGTLLCASLKASAPLSGATMLKNGESKEFLGIRVAAVPAYNRKNMRPSGEPYHPKGVGNGYVLHFGKTRIYIAGDTELIPEMEALKGMDVAFLPVNVPYTMSVDMLVEAALLLQPRVLYPYHTGDTDMARVQSALQGVAGVETRIRPMK